jgi:hypothetical protein
MKIKLGILIAACGVQFCGCASPAKVPVAVAPSSGKELCSALVPADFTKVDVPVKAFLSANVNPGDSTSAYCTYESQNGNIEFDVFYPAGDTPEEVRATEKTVLSEGSEGKSQPIAISGADTAEINLAIPGKTPSASITVRKNTAVFAIYIPANPNAQAELSSLAQTVLGRLQP